MQKRKKTVITMRDEAKLEVVKNVDSMESQREASKIVGILWGQMLAATLDKLGWTPTRFNEKTGISNDSFSRWLRGHQEPDPPNDKILVDLWEAELGELKKYKHWPKSG